MLFRSENMTPIFTNEENNYPVARVKYRCRRDLVTVVGNITSPLT
jgi:hypothetical protein